MSRAEILQKLENGPLLFDGAMGTYYATLSRTPTEKCEFANRTEPDLVRQIHCAYIDAGCGAIKTNTFAVPAIAMEYGMQEAETLVEQAWAIANEAKAAAGEGNAAIFADFGPPAPAGGDTPDGSVYQILADKFLSLGASNFLFETFVSDSVIRTTAAHIRAVCPDAYIIATFAVTPDGFTGEGLPGRELVQNLLDDGIVDAAGFNCVSGPGHLLKMVEGMDTAHYPLAVMPNAGYPTVVGGRTIYNNSPAYFAGRLQEMAARGVKILGGCCGTDPEYMRAVVAALPGARPTDAGTRYIVTDRAPDAATAPSLDVTERLPYTAPLPSPNENRFFDKLMRGERVIAVELDSPLDSHIEKYMAGAAVLKAAGADIITIADCPVARSRMDSSLVACKLRRELGIDALPHLTCRDRNLNATRALLLGLSAEGVHNVLIVTGDPIPSAERDVVKSVYNFNSRMLARYIRQLNEEVFQTPFFIGGALNVNAVNFDAQLRQAKEKAANGIGALFTQPVMTERAAENLRRAKDTLDVKILGGIMPVVSHRNAAFIAGEIQGIEIAPETVAQFEGKSKEDCTKLGIDLSLEMAAKIDGDVDGYYLITPFSRTDMIAAIMENLS